MVILIGNFTLKKNDLKLKPGEIHNVNFFVENNSNQLSSVQQHLMFHPLHSVYI